MSDSIELNGRRYRKPERPTVVICVDGCDPEYLERGIPEGVFPMIGSFAHTGYLGTAEAAMPTFTNPNNVSIVTGAPPSVHGIAGNYCLDRETGREIMMTDDRLMRSETILALMAAAGVKTAAITAKDKLRKLLGRNLGGLCFSSECADAEVEALVGRTKPDMYSADLSLFVLDAGIGAASSANGPGSSICRSRTTSSTPMRRAIPKPTPSIARSTIGCGAWSSWAPSSGSSPTTA